jgi:2-polyprenyl-3-methyl-5-hydroxy-6-metoxy-1,4-benzoquinol methylase
VRRDRQSIARALQRLVDTPALLEQIGRGAQRLVAAHHDVRAALDAIETRLRARAGSGRAPSAADVARVRELNGIFEEMRPFLEPRGATAGAVTPRAAAGAPADAFEPGTIRRALWALLGEGETGRKRAWRTGKLLARRTWTLPGRMARTFLHLLRLDTHLGYIAERLETLDRTTSRSLADLRQLGQRLEAIAEEMAGARTRFEDRVETLDGEARRLRGDLDGLHAEVAQRLGGLEQAARSQLAEIDRRLGAVQQKGDATNADLGSLVSHLRYIGMLPEPSPPGDGAPSEAPPEWPMEAVERCILCGGSAFSPYGTKGGFTIVRCDACGLLLVNPRLQADGRFRLYSTSYWAEHMRSYNLPTFWERISIDYALALKRVLLVSEFAAGRRLLDIGCSNGAFLRRAAEWGFESYGLELTPEMAREATRLSGRPVFAGDLGASTEMLGDLHFDHATMFDLLEHLYDPHAFLRNLCSVMEPGGRVVIETFRTDCRDFEEQFLDHDDIKPLEHIYMYRERHLQELFARHGFAPVAKRYPLGEHHSRVIFVIEKTG